MITPTTELAFQLLLASVVLGDSEKHSSPHPCKASLRLRAPSRELSMHSPGPQLTAAEGLAGSTGSSPHYHPISTPHTFIKDETKLGEKSCVHKASCLIQLGGKSKKEC